MYSALTHSYSSKEFTLFQYLVYCIIDIWNYCAEYFSKCKAEERGIAVAMASDDNAAIRKIGKQQAKLSVIQYTSIGGGWK